MATPSDFDPLREWLGIPISERPPTHYALLGLAPLESDHERIQAAYLRRYQAVRRYEVGPRQETAVQLLEELSRAFLVLSNPERKQDYDLLLQSQKLQSSPQPAAGNDSPVVGTLEASVQASCPNPKCAAPFLLQHEWAGSQANCKTCGVEFVIGNDLTLRLVSTDRTAEPAALIIETSCPNANCSAPFVLQREWVGARANCKTCGVEFAIGEDFTLILLSNARGDRGPVRNRSGARPPLRLPAEWEELDEIRLLEELAKLQEDLRRFVLDGQAENLPDLPILRTARAQHDLLAGEIMDLTEQAEHLKSRHEQLLETLAKLAHHSDALAQQSRQLEESHERIGQVAYQAFVAGALPDLPLFKDRKACGFRLARLQDDQRRLADSGWLAQKAKGQALLAINRAELQRERSLARSLEIKMGRELVETDTLHVVRCQHTERVVSEVLQLQTRAAQASRTVTQLRTELEADNHVVPPSLELAKVLAVNRYEAELTECKQQTTVKQLQLTTLRASFPQQLLESVQASELPANGRLARLVYDLRAARSELQKRRALSGMTNDEFPNDEGSARLE